MKVLIVMFLGTVIAQGSIPKLKCWNCEGVLKNGKHPCNDPQSFTLQDCEKENKTMCIDVFDPEDMYFSKSCADEGDLRQIESIATYHNQKLIYKVCDITECNPGIFSDYLDKHQQKK